MKQRIVRIAGAVILAALLATPAFATAGEDAVKAAEGEVTRMGQSRTDAWEALQAEEKEVKELKELKEKSTDEAQKKELDERIPLAEKVRDLAKDWHKAADTAYIDADKTLTEAGKYKDAEKAGAGVDAAKTAFEAAKKTSDASIKKADAAKLSYAVTGSEKKRSIGESISERVLLQIGLVTLNPYKIEEDSSGKLKLKSSSTTAKAYAQISFTHTWAWLSDEERRGNDEERQANGQAKEYTLLGRSSLDDYWVPDDFDIRLGYTFGADDTSGAAVVGGGDLSGNTVVGWNVYRGVLAGDSSISFSAPVLGLGMVTGRDILDIHSNLFVGLGVNVGTPVTTDLLGSKGRRALLVWRLGWAGYEVPSLHDNTDQVNKENGFAKFERVWNGIANEFEFRLPVRKSGYITATGGFYNNSDPNPWTFQLGYSVPLEQLESAVTGLVGVFN